MDDDININDLYNEVCNNNENDININRLLQNIDYNDYINNETISSIANTIYQSLQNYDISNDLIYKYSNKLKDYKYIDEMCELKKGKYIRWLRGNTLTNGGIITDVSINEDYITITCKNYMNRFITYKWDDCLTYQKLTTEEQLILIANERCNV
tara:strand:+ start:5714 stop:6175 length:462 start_codon:yes stop_codon:yes gene_type:complete